MAPKESIFKKIWNVLAPVILLFALYFSVVYGGIFLFTSPSFAGKANLDTWMSLYYPLLTVLALVIIGIAELLIFRRDFPYQSQVFKQKPAHIGVLLLIGAALSHAFTLLISLIPSEQLAAESEAVSQEIYSAGALFAILRAVILAPLVEELVFRGLVFRRMRRFANIRVASLVSALLFGLYHMNLLQGIYAFCFGFFICLVYERYQNLWAAILLHFAANLLSVIVAYTGFTYTSYVTYFASLVLLLAVAVLGYIFFIRKVKE